MKITLGMDRETLEGIVEDLMDVSKEDPKWDRFYIELDTDDLVYVKVES